MVPHILGSILLYGGRLAMKYIIVPAAVTAATAFVLGGLVERVRRQKALENGVVRAEYQTHLAA